MGPTRHIQPLAVLAVAGSGSGSDDVVIGKLNDEERIRVRERERGESEKGFKSEWSKEEQSAASLLLKFGGGVG